MRLGGQRMAGRWFSAISVLLLLWCAAAAADGCGGGDSCPVPDRRDGGLKAEEVRVRYLTGALRQEDVVRALSRQQQFADSFGMEVPVHRQEDAE